MNRSVLLVQIGPSIDPSVLLAQLGPSAAFLGLLIWIARLYFSGKLIPKSEVDRMQQNFEQQITRERQISDDWREVALSNTEVLDKLNSQTDRLLDSQKTVEAFILSLPRVGSNEQSAIGSRRLTQGPGGTWQ